MRENIVLSEFQRLRKCLINYKGERTRSDGWSIENTDLIMETYISILKIYSDFLLPFSLVRYWLHFKIILEIASSHWIIKYKSDLMAFRTPKPNDCQSLAEIS